MLSRLRQAVMKYISASIGHVARAGVIGLILGLIVGEVLGWAFEAGWPSLPYAHIVALVFAIVLSYALAISAALWAVLRGIIEVTTHLDDAAIDVAKMATGGGVGVIDAVVDALDGPNRHGIR